MAGSLLYYDIDKAAAELCRRKLSRFVQEMWHVVATEKLVWEPHMEVLCDAVQEVFERVFLQPDPENPEEKIRLKKLHDLIINIPPGTTKSTIVTIMAPAWAWTRDASLRIITGSYSDSLATEHSTKSRDIIQSDIYRRYYPEVQIKDHKGLKTNYETTANGQRYATSVGGTLTGVHAHVLIWDDPLNAKQSGSKVETKAANEWMDKTASTRKVDKEVTVTILIMQRLAVNDCTGHQLDKKKEAIKHICLPAELSKNVKPESLREIYQNGLLSPLRLSKAALAELRKDLGSSGYAGQMQQEPAPDGGTIWQKWFVEVPDDIFPDIEQAEDLATDWDLAYTKEEKNSASAYFKSGIIANRIYIFDFDWKHLEFPELIKWMNAVEGPHYIEGKASGKSARQTLKKEGVLAIEVKVQGDKISRAKSATPTAEAGMVYIRKSMADKLYNDPKQGILFFPNGEHNDGADALSQMITRRTKKGKIHTAGGAEATAQADDTETKQNPLDWIK